MPRHRAQAATVNGFRALPSLGLASATSATSGVLVAFSFGDLPSPAWPIATAIAALLAMVFAPRTRPLAAFALGLAWACLHGSWGMAQRLPHAFERRDVEVEIVVSGLPRRSLASTRFDARVVGANEPALRGLRARVAWYGREAPVLRPGERWRLALRLKRPRGGVNPGGFDFERYALERRIDATGYVRESGRNRRLGEARGMDALRSELSLAMARAIDARSSSRDARFVQALAVGDVRGLDEHDREVLRATGIAHLIAISGMHVGLVAGFGALLVRLAYRAAPAAGLRLPLPQGAAVGALLTAAAYTALAGFALPTVRTLLMIATVLLAVLLRRAVDTTQAFALALIATLAVDPLGLLGAGFWLSFLGVAWLLWCLPREGAQPAWRMLLSAQGVMTVSLLPLGVWFFGQASIVGPFANLVAVPWVSFVVVPIALCGTLLELLAAGAGAACFVAAAWAMQAVWSLLEKAAAWHGAIAWLPEPAPAAFALALLGAFWWLLPRGVPGKPLAAMLWLPLFWPAQRPLGDGELEVVLFDVGQGLALLVRTRGHALVYDAGPAFESGLDQGEVTVVPGLRALGVRRLDAYIESHGHADHAGGTDAVLRAFAPARVYAADPARVAATQVPSPWPAAREEASPVRAPRGIEACVAGMHWQWDGVRFEFLHPPPDFPYLDNDSSCVLVVHGQHGSLLVPGDISASIEQRLLRAALGRLRADVLVVPHHGSRTSSSEAFLRAVAPRVALIGTGHGNRFGLPRREVLHRYARHGVRVLRSDEHGAVTLRLDGRGGLPAATRREHPRRPWRED